MNDITKIDDARAMKAMGQPLNTPVEDRPASRVVTKHWRALEKHVRFVEDAASRWLADPNDAKLWSLVIRRLNKLGAVFEETNRAVNRFMGLPVNTIGPTPLSPEQEAARMEADPSMIVLCGLLPRVRDYLNFWANFGNQLAACKPGDQLDIAHLLGAPKVFDDGVTP